MKTSTPHNYQSRYSPTPVIRVGIVSLFAGLLFIAQSYGATLSWSGGGGGDANWNNSANWGFAGTPQNGDIVIFPASQPNLVNTNNISGLVLNQIRFVGTGGGYVIFGNPVTLTNSIWATNTAGANNINFNLTVSNLTTTILIVSNGTSLTLSNVISGTGDITKAGAGQLTFGGSGNNIYTGNALVADGVLALNKVSGWAIGYGALTIGDGTGATSSAIVRDFTNNQIYEVNVTVNADGLLDLNSHNDVILDLTLNGGGGAQSGTGTLSLLGSQNVTVNSGYSSIYGNFNVGSGTCTIQGNGTLYLYANMSGSASIVKNGTLNVELAGANTFTGSFTANGSGWVWINNPLSLGTTNGGTTINDQAWLAISGSINITNEALTMNSTYGDALYVYSTSANNWYGTVTLMTNTSVFVDTGCALTLNGPIGGAGGITKVGPGTLTLSGPGNSSSYAGNTTVNEGILQLNSINVIRYGTLTIGDGVGGANADVVRYLTGGCIYGGGGGSQVFISSSGLLDLNGFSDDVGPIAMDGGNITTGAGSLQIFPPVTTLQSTNGGSTISGNLTLRDNTTFAITNDLDLEAAVTSSSTYTFTKTGPGNLYLSASNSYSGLTVVQQGFLWAYNAWALGTTNSGTIVSNSASLVLNGSFGITNETLTLNGPGVSSVWGALDSETSGTNIWVGPITLNSDSTIDVWRTNTVLRIIGPITGAGGIEQFSGNTNWGQVYFEGTNINTYLGTTRVDSGTLLLSKSVTDGSIPHDLNINGTVWFLNNSQVANTGNVTIQGSGAMYMNGHTDYINALSGTGTVDLGSAWLVVCWNGASSTYDGVVSGAGDLYKFANGIFTLTASNTLTGMTHIWGGTLLVNGFQPQSSVEVSGSTTLGGSGTVGDIISTGGIVAPGSSPGILTSSNVVFNSSSVFSVELNGPTPGTDYDQLNVRGTNNLGSALLGINLAFTSPVAVGQQFTIINNDGVDPITGIFASYPEGSTWSENGFTVAISYVGGNGNDVVLTLTDVPGDQGGYAVTSGNGNQVIDPNECNNLNIVITNKTGAPMTGVSATLTTTSTDVVITQPESAYPDVPAYGSRTNTTPFQISTLSTFTCGSDINLLLTVNSSLGSFSMPVVLRTGGTATVPVQYDVSGNLSIPDTGTVVSTNTVSSFSGPLMKVGVSLYLTHTYDADLTISLIAPDNTTVLLTSGNGGSGQNYGASCSPDGSRTTFDDAGAAAITNGVGPFTGTFRPQGALTNFIGTTANGDWRLQITDCCGGSLGTLRCWSLFLYPVACADGGGVCDTCPGTFSGSIDTNDLVQTGRLTRNGIVSTCAAPKSCPGLANSTPVHYDIYTFTNTGPDTCVTVDLDTPGSSANMIFAQAYLGSFNPADLCTNYLGDLGASHIQSSGEFSFIAPSNAVYLVVVNEVTANAGCTNYTLVVRGAPCPPPTLNASLVPNNRIRVDWPTSAGGYKLESIPSLALTDWSVVTNDPIVSSGRFNVTNITTGTNRFYRLDKP